jgi:two-component system cell cycle sensor histidine kinase/response regulator CckA
LAHAIESASDCIFICDFSEKIIFVNKAFCRTFGYSDSEVVGKRVSMLHDETDLAIIPDIQAATVKGGWQGELWNRSKTGRRFPVWLSTSLIADDSGAPIAFVGVLRETTQQKMAEAELATNGSILRSFIAHTPAAVAMLDNDLRYLQVSDQWIKDYRLEGIQLVGRSHYEVFPQTPAEWKRVNARVLRGAVERCAQDLFVRADGTTEWLRWEARPWRKSDGSIGGLMMFTQVITESKKSEETLSHLRSAVQASREAIFMTDSNGIITFVNPEFTRMYGHSSEEVVGKCTPRILKSGETNDYSTFWQTLLQEQTLHREMVNRTKDGRRITVEASVNAIRDDRGCLSGFLAIQRDVTDRKQLEQQFLQAQKMDALGRLAGGVAHDFNNLLGVISGYAELMLEDTDVTERAAQRITEIKKASNRAVEVTRQLLAFSRKQVLQAKTLKLNDSVRETSKMLGRLVGEDIQLTLELDRELDCIYADPTGIDQVLLNLSVNARDAMPDGGTLVIRTSNLTATPTTHPELQPGRYVCLQVTDDGDGMSEETKKRVFEPFFTTKAPGKGTGLGLSTVFGIVEQCKGHISVESEPGLGSCFSLCFPSLDRSVDSHITERDNAPRGNETVLLVEDDQSLRELNRELLTSLGYVVLTAQNGRAATDLAAAHPGPISLLLTDVVMPGINGRVLAELILSTRSETKVLYVSGYTNNIVTSGTLDARSAFLQKPFGRAELATKVRELLGKRSAPLLAGIGETS